MKHCIIVVSRDHISRGYPFRFGFFEVPVTDLKKIKYKMLTGNEPLLNNNTLWNN